MKMLVTSAVVAASMFFNSVLASPTSEPNNNVSIAKRGWSSSSEYDYERKGYYCDSKRRLWYHMEGQSYQYGYQEEDRRPDEWGRVFYCGQDKRVRYRAHKDRFRHEYSYEKNYGWDERSNNLWYRNRAGLSYRWEHSRHAYYCKRGDNRVYHWYDGREYVYGSRERDYYQDSEWYKRQFYCKSDNRLYYKKWDDKYDREYSYQTWYYRKNNDNDLYWRGYDGNEWKWSQYRSNSYDWSSCPSYNTDWNNYWNQWSSKSYRWGYGSIDWSLPRYSNPWSDSSSNRGDNRSSSKSRSDSKSSSKKSSSSHKSRLSKSKKY